MFVDNCCILLILTMTNTFLTVETCVTEAHHPRNDPASIVNPDDRLKLVYNIYTDDRPGSTKLASEEDGMNLVFLAGAQMTKEVWEYMIELAFNYFGPRVNKCISVDQVHVGDSCALNEGKLTNLVLWSDCAKDTIKVVKELKLQGPTIPIGHSMGGTISLFCAHYEPFLFDSVVIIDPVIYLGPSELFYHEEVVKRSGKIFSSIYRQAKEKFNSRKEYEDYIRTRTFARDFHPKVQQSHIQGIAKDGPNGTVVMKASRELQTTQYLSGMINYRGALDIFKLLDMEVLHIAPEIADWNLLTATPALREALQYCTPVDIAGGTHNCPYNLPNETFAGMKDFLERRHKRGVEILKEVNARKNVTEQERKAMCVDEFQKDLAAMAEGKRRFYFKL